MASDGTGRVYIPLEEFWVYVRKQSGLPDGSEVLFNFGRIEKQGDEIVIEYAYSHDTGVHPHEWANGKPEWMDGGADE